MFTPQYCSRIANVEHVRTCDYAAAADVVVAPSLLSTVRRLLPAFMRKCMDDEHERASTKVCRRIPDARIEYLMWHSSHECRPVHMYSICTKTYRRKAMSFSACV